MKILICGSRGWHDPVPINLLIAGYDVLAEGAGEKLTIVHGNAPDGADRLADRLGRRWKANIVRVDARWDRWGKGAGHERNVRMLAEHPDIVAVYAFRSTGKSNGTDDMVELSQAANIPTYIVTGGPPVTTD